MQDYDVAVVGLGSVGSMALWRTMIARPGAKVIGIEQYGRAHSLGSFTGESRVFRTAYHEGPRYVPILRHARALWRELEAVSGRDLYLEVGMLTIGRKADADFQNVVASVEQYDIPHERFDADGIRARFPQHAVDDIDAGVLDLHGGGIRSEAAVLAAITAAERAGAEIVTGTAVTSIDEDEDVVRIGTGTGTVRAKKVIVATGSWSSVLAPELDHLITIKPLLLTWFQPERPEDFLPDRFTAFIRDKGPLHAFGVPMLDGYSVKVSPGIVLDPVNAVDEVDRGGITPELLVEMGRVAHEFLPGLIAEPVRWSIHHDGFIAGSIPVIDRSEGGRIVTMAGFSGHGFKMAPALGDIAALLATEGGSDLHHEDFTIAAHLAAPVPAAH